MTTVELEQRISALEHEIQRIKQKLQLPRSQPWWENIVGVFENDPAFDEAMRLGREYHDNGGEL